MTILVKRFSHRHGGEIFFLPVVKPTLNPIQKVFKIVKGAFKNA